MTNEGLVLAVEIVHTFIIKDHQFGSTKRAEFHGYFGCYIDIYIWLI